MNELSEGTILALFHQQTNNPLYSNPILQIISKTKVEGSGKVVRYRVNLSDGKNYMPGILCQEVSALLENGTLGNFHLIKIEKFDIRQTEKHSYIYVVKVGVSIVKTEKIGKPVKLGMGKEVGSGPLNVELDTQLSNNQNTPNLVQPPAKKIKISEDSPIKIKELNPFIKNWAAKGRVASKSEIRRFKNSTGGEGKLFSFEFEDGETICKVAAFTDAVDLYYNLIENKKTYLIKNGSIRVANKQFSTASNFDYEIHLDRTSIVEEILDSDIPEHNYTFTSVKDLKSKGTGLVDFIGILVSVFPPSKIIAKASKNEFDKRDMILADESGSIKFTLWGERALQEYEKGTVMLASKCKVGNFNGNLFLSTISSSEILKNTECQRGIDLLKWYSNEGSNVVVAPVTGETYGKMSLISEAIESEAQYHNIKGTLSFIKEDSIFYTACPAENCKKKMTAEENGNYRCEKCNYTYDTCNYSYLLTGVISDYTGQIWVTMFNNTGEKLFNQSAKDLIGLNGDNAGEIISAIKSKLFSEYNFKCRVREDEVNGQKRKRFQVVDLKEIDYNYELDELAKTVKAVIE